MSGQSTFKEMQGQLEVRVSPDTTVVLTVLKDTSQDH